MRNGRAPIAIAPAETCAAPAVVEAPALVAGGARRQPFELAAPDRGEVLAVRRARRRAVQVRGDAELAPDARGGAVRQRDRVVERRVAERNERQHVERADPRVRAAVRAQVDSLVRDARQRDRRGDDLRAAADRGDHAAMVNGIAGAVHDARPLRFHRGGGGVDHLRVASLAQVRDDLELVRYFKYAWIDSSGCAGSARPPKFCARNASTAALKRLLFSGRAKPWPSSGNTT